MDCNIFLEDMEFFGMICLPALCCRQSRYKWITLREKQSKGDEREKEEQLGMLLNAPSLDMAKLFIILVL